MSEPGPRAGFGAGQGPDLEGAGQDSDGEAAAAGDIHEVAVELERAGVTELQFETGDAQHPDFGEADVGALDEARQVAEHGEPGD